MNKRKGIEAQRAKHRTLTWSIDVLIEDEEQMGGKKRKTERASNPMDLWDIRGIDRIPN